MIDVAADDSLIVELHCVGHGSSDILDVTEQPFRVRVLLTEIAYKDRVTNFKTPDLDMILLTRLSLSNSF